MANSRLGIVLSISVLAIIGCGSSGNDVVSVVGVSLNKASTTLGVAATEQLTSTIDPVNATNQSVTWSSSDDAVATVDTAGLVTGEGEGTATITVTTADGSFTADCVATVFHTFSSSVLPGDLVPVTAGTTEFNMIYANSSDTTVTIPTGTDDDGTADIDRKFFMAETETTNALVAEVMQWAYDDGRFSDTAADPNGIDATTVRFGGQQLLDLDDVDIKISFDVSSSTFSVDSGFETHPAANIKWFGAIMFCNWLTEMKDGNADNVVYSGMTDTWANVDTIADDSKRGYRLPTSNEWEYAARYIDGTDWTYGDHASGDESGACYDDGDILGGLGLSVVYDDYAWHWENSDTGSGRESHPVKSKIANHLGLFNMNGNLTEWVFTTSGGARVIRGSSWDGDIDVLQVGYVDQWTPDWEYNWLGFRIAVGDGGGNAPPAVMVQTPAGPQSVDVTMTYDLSDLESDTCSIEVEYQGGSVGTTWTTASVTGTTSGLSPDTDLTIIWNSALDESAQAAADYKIRIRAHDGTEYGAWDGTSAFEADNTWRKLGGLTSPADFVTIEAVGDMVIDGSDRIYFSDWGNNRIIRIDDITGAGWTTYGTSGSGVGQFSRPLGLALDSTGRVYICDKNNGRIIRMDDMSGTNWTSYATSVNGPVDVEIDTTGRILFVDQSGLYGGLTQIDDMIGTNRTDHTLPEIGYESLPMAVSIDSTNRIYVSVDDSSDVYRIDDIAGTNSTTIAGMGEYQDIHIDRSTDEIYTGEGYWYPNPGFVGSRLKVMDAADLGNSTGFGPGGSKLGEVMGVNAIAVDSSGRIYTAEEGDLMYVLEYNMFRIARVDDTAGTNWTSLQAYGADTDGFSAPVGMAFDSQNRIYIADRQNGRVVRMDDISGTNWISYGSYGSGTGQFEYPYDVALDGQGRIYVTDSWNERVVRIDDMNGTNWTTVGTFGAGPGPLKFNTPRGIEIDSLDRIYVSDIGLIRFDDMTGTNWTNLSGFSFPNGICTDQSNQIYVADTNNDRIVFIEDMAGTGWINYGASGAGVDQFSKPMGVSLDAYQRIVVADQENHRIVRFDDMLGVNWTAVGALGSGTDQFRYPEAVGVDSVGRIYVSDTRNQRMVLQPLE